MQLGLDNLRDILKSDEYKMDTSTLLGVSSWPSGASSLSDPLLQVQRAEKEFKGSTLILNSRDDNITNYK